LNYPIIFERIVPELVVLWLLQVQLLKGIFAYSLVNAAGFSTALVIPDWRDFIQYQLRILKK